MYWFNNKSNHQEMDVIDSNLIEKNSPNNNNIPKKKLVMQIYCSLNLMVPYTWCEQWPFYMFNWWSKFA